VLVGVIPGLLKPILLKKANLWRVYLIILINIIITSMGITTYILSGLYGTPYFELLLIRAPIALAIGVVDGLVVFILYKRLSKEVL
jgi:hypothetical protein